MASARERLKLVLEPIGPTIRATFTAVAARTGAATASGNASAKASTVVATRRDAGPVLLLLRGGRRDGPPRPGPPRLLSLSLVPGTPPEPHGPIVPATGQCAGAPL